MKLIYSALFAFIVLTGHSQSANEFYNKGIDRSNSGESGDFEA